MKVLLSILLSLAAVANAAMYTDRYFKTVAEGHCMGVDNHGYMYIYPCHSSLVVPFERAGTHLKAKGGAFSGLCMDNFINIYPYFDDCSNDAPSQFWEFQPDGRWTGYLNGEEGREEYCLKLLNPGHIRVVMGKSSEGGCMIWMDSETGTIGDPIITGLAGQQFKFDGRDDAWYANMATPSLHWNMKFKEFPTCPAGDDMFVSSLAYDFGEGNTVLIATTPEKIARCENEVCLGDGTLHISFDQGETFVSNPSDTSFGVGHRVVSHNTYDACSRKWFDFDINASQTEASTVLRGRNARALSGGEKAALQYLTEQKQTTIRQEECEGWIEERFQKNDLFMQKGQWATIHIETPKVSLHVEYRRSNLGRDVEGQCDFQSLDAWMTRVSKELYVEEWNGILGETRNKKGIEGRENILRGPNDADYEVSGPFVREFPALHMK